MAVPYTGNEPGTLVPAPSAGLFFDFNVSTIRLLLSRPGAVGVRLHLNQDRPTLPTELFAAACDATDDLSDPTENQQDYFISNGSGIAFADLPPTFSSRFGKGEKTAGCIYFSRNILENSILGPFNAPFPATKVRFHVVDFGVSDSKGVPCLTLIATGRTLSGALSGDVLRSDQPCPPNCPTDPDSPYGRR